MGKRILVAIILLLVIIGCFAMNITKRATILGINQNKIVSLKYYVDENTYKNYYTIPKDLKNKSVDNILNSLNEKELNKGIKISKVKNSNRRIYMILEGKETIIINNNKLDDNKYIVQFYGDSFWDLNRKDNYIMIDSENIKNVFLNLDEYFLGKNYINNKISI